MTVVLSACSNLVNFLFFLEGPTDDELVDVVVVFAAAGEDVVAAGTAEGVVAAGTDEGVVAAGTDEGVVAAGTDEGVVAAGTGEGVAAAGTGEVVAAAGTGEGVSVVDSSLLVCPTESVSSACRSVVGVLDLLVADDTVELSSKAGGLTTALFLII